MAYSYISANQNTISGTSPLNVSYPNTPAYGGLLICTVRRNTQGGTAISVVDASNNPFTLLGTENFNGTGDELQIFGMLAGFNQGKVMTVAGSGTIQANIYEFDFSGGALPNINQILDAIAETNDGGSAVTSTSGLQPSVSPVGTADLVFTTVGVSAAISSPSFTNATLLDNNNSLLFDGYQIETSAGTYNPYASWTTSRFFGQITGAFLPGLSTYPYVKQVIGGAADNSASSFSISSTPATTTGNDILVIVTWYRVSGTFPTCAITDTQGNTYTSVGIYNGVAAGAPTTQVFQAHNTTGLASGNSITATFSGGSGAPFATMVALEAVNLSTNLDGSVVTGNGGAGTAVAFSGLTTSANQNDLVLVSVGSMGNLTATKWSAGWSFQGFQSAAPTTSVAWQNVLTTDAISGTATLGASELWAYLIIAFKAAGGGGSTSPIGKDIMPENNNLGAFIYQATNRSNTY